MIKNVYLPMTDSVELNNTSFIQKITIADGDERIEMYDVSA